MRVSWQDRFRRSLYKISAQALSARDLSTRSPYKVSMRVAWQNRFRRSLCKISATQDLCKRFLNWQDLFKTSSQDLCLRSLYRVPAQHPCKWSLGKTLFEQISWQDRRKRPHKIPIQGLYVMSLGKISVQGLYKICWQDCCPCARSL